MSSLPPPPPPSSGPQPPYPGSYDGGYQPHAAAAPNHPQAVTALVLGIVGLAVCGVCGPFALFIGRRAMREIDASAGRQGGRGFAQAGFIMGIVSSCLLVVGVLALLLFVVAAGSSRLR